MLFNSYVFVLFFLPITLIGYYTLSGFRGYRSARYWLVGASLLFYGWWNPIYLWLLLASIATNFVISQLLFGKTAHRKKILIFGVIANLGLLGYFKYADFFLATISAIAPMQFSVLHIVLPLGISFFTLQQMAYLFDSYEGLTEERSFVDYAVFATFFPLLLSGPIVHHRDLLPQFRTVDAGRFKDHNFAYGLFVFAVGLFKKTVIADSLVAMVAVGFDSNATISATDAWLASTAFTLQAYFDFSGYSDMAVGIGLLFNVKLPLNFNSPYQATSIIQFWQRWHITLTDFINAYVYMPMMRLRQSFSFYYSLCVTVVAMTIVGLWHGASWNYVLFGLLHGMALVTNHLWRRFGFRVHRIFGWLLTIFWWHLTLVIFRATSLASALRIYKNMFAGDWHWIGKDMYEAFPLLSALPVQILTFAMFLLFAILFVACAKLRNPHDHVEAFKPSLLYFAITFVCLLSSILLMNHVTEFIYFQF